MFHQFTGYSSKNEQIFLKIEYVIEGGPSSFGFGPSVISYSALKIGTFSNQFMN